MVGLENPDLSSVARSQLSSPKATVPGSYLVERVQMQSKYRNCFSTWQMRSKFESGLESLWDWLICSNRCEDGVLQSFKVCLGFLRLPPTPAILDLWLVKCKS